MINLVSEQLKKSLPAELADVLLQEYEKVKDNFLLGKHEPSELNAGKFCEVVFRILQFQTSPDNSYTPLTKNIHNFVDEATNFAQLPKSISDTFRLHIPRVLIALYNIRNHRGVGHIGGEVSPNTADATLLNTGCDWILAEFVRTFHICTIEEADRIVQRIIKRKIPFVYSIGDRKRVLLIKGYENKALLLLLEEYPKEVLAQDLFKWTEHSHITKFKTLLKTMHKSDLIDFHNGSCVLTPVGVRAAEEFLLAQSL